MIRLFLFSRHLPSLTREQFHNGLLHEHAPLVRECGGFRAGCHAYMQNHFSGEVAYSGASATVSEARFDNCSEFWYESIDHILKSYNNDDYFGMLRPDENIRTDGSIRIALLAEEAVVFEEPSEPATALKSKILVLSLSKDAADIPPVAKMQPNLGPKVHCIRKTVNTVRGVMDFANAKMSEHEVPIFSTITTYTLAPREKDGSTRPVADQFDLYDDAIQAEQVALWARSHVIFGPAG